MIDQRYIRNFDFVLALATATILVFGCLAIYSAAGTKATYYVERQLVYALIGILGAIIAASIDHETYHRYAGKLYGWTIVLLLFVLKFGHQSKGAVRWIALGPFQFQPSEFAKVVMVICLAIFFATRQDQIREFKTVVLSLLYIAVPMLLIFKQPDLGTSLTLIAIWVVTAFVAGVDAKHLLAFGLFAVLLGVAAWYVPGVMKDYQKARLVSFINPNADPLGSGYHVIQSRIAIGSGRFLGKGYLKGTQRKLRFIPEQHTDFIFTVVGEELGFVGAVGLVALYFIFLWRALDIMAAAEDARGRLIAAGIVGMFLFHIFVNLGMTLGIMPVTGVPLPFFSYGGSSLVTALIAVGLLEGISIRRHKISF
ncbi:MAG: rod shape-determining protein RodA [Armatimonadota bacterium]|nr:rod shape-determining protein RodA [Armatimonadota bacterium]